MHMLGDGARVARKGLEGWGSVLAGHADVVSGRLAAKVIFSMAVRLMVDTINKTAVERM